MARRILSWLASQTRARRRPFAMSVTFPIDLSQKRRLLIIRLSSIGDVVHALPVSAALGESFPSLEITWIVEEMSAQIVEGNPYLHEVIVIPRGRWKRGRLSGRTWAEQAAFFRDLRRRRFDVTLDLQGYAKSGVIAMATGAPDRYGFWNLREMSRLVSRPVAHEPANRHRVEWFLEAAAALGVRTDQVHFPFAIPDGARAHVRDLLDETGIGRQPYAVLNPAVGDEIRRWDARGFAEISVALAREHGITPLLIGSARDEPLCRSIADLAEAISREPGRTGAGSTSSLMEGLVRPVVLAGRTDLKQLAAILDGAAVHVAGDTGSLHIAAALGRPVLALFGPTDPAHAGPWGQSENVITRREACGAACTPRQCAFPPERPEEAVARCMRNISKDEVMSRIERVLASNEPVAVS